MLEKYINEIIKNGQNSTFINGIEWYCEYHNKTTGEFTFKRIEGQGICEVYDDDISLKYFERWFPKEEPCQTLTDEYKSKCVAVE